MGLWIVKKNLLNILRTLCVCPLVKRLFIPAEETHLSVAFDSLTVIQLQINNVLYRTPINHHM